MSHVFRNVLIFIETYCQYSPEIINVWSGHVCVSGHGCVYGQCVVMITLRQLKCYLVLGQTVHVYLVLGHTVMSILKF
jgi:hypothetical protein